jgi:predicted transcriptional regulator
MSVDIFHDIKTVYPGTNLRRLILINGLKNKDIARLLKISQPVFCRYVSGQRKIPNHHLTVLAALFNCEEREIID